MGAEAKVTLIIAKFNSKMQSFEKFLASGSYSNPYGLTQKH